MAARHRIIVIIPAILLGGAGLLAAGAAFAHAALPPLPAIRFGMARPPAPKPYLEGEMLVKFRADVTAEQITRFNAEQGCAIAETISGLGIHRLRLPEGASVPEMVARYEASGLVEFAEPNHRVSISPVHPFRPVGPLEVPATPDAEPKP